ncbi:RbsD/FucU domain-containing protein [Flavobacterium sp.]|uniref:RbsD/FucU domain-containing protein n=1 Tax=Flavobacterium sp. TaxID=239 RepID=UPI00286C0F5A|nr:RbsD/FucU domain-containing protein [Flavobacterium sp.]
MIQKTFLFFTVFLLFSCTKPIPKLEEVIPSKSQNWKFEVEKTIQLFGHRNWIVVADGAYPKQSNPAIKTITVDANQLEVVQFVNEVVKKSTHVRANIFVDKEMAFVAEKDAKGIENYKTELGKIIDKNDIKTQLHEAIIKELDNSAKLFDVLIIKTNLSIPYTSVFFQLDCGYWNAEAEKNLRTSLLAN